MTLLLGLIACYLLLSTVGTLIFVGIASHICSRECEFYEDLSEFVAEANEAWKRGEL